MAGSQVQLSLFEGGNEMKELRFFQVANNHLTAYCEVESQTWLGPKQLLSGGKRELKSPFAPLTVLLSHPSQKQVILNTDAPALQFSSFVQGFLFPRLNLRDIKSGSSQSGSVLSWDYGALLHFVSEVSPKPDRSR